MKAARELAVSVLIAACSLVHHAAAEAVDQGAAAAAPRAEPRRVPSSLEIYGAIGPSVVFGEPANPQYAQSFTRVGGFGELGVAYRSSYFVDPFLSVAYAILASGESVLPAGAWGPGGTLNQKLAAWVISPGVTADIWRFRLRLGLGFAVVVQSFEFLGSKNSSTQLPVASQLGFGFNAFGGERLRIDVEARAVVAPGADVSFATITAVVRGDLLYFGSD